MSEEPKPDKPTRFRRGDIAFTTSIPQPVYEALEAMRRERGLTKRTLVLEALRAIGLPVEDDDLTDKRGRVPKSGRKDRSKNNRFDFVITS